MYENLDPVDRALASLRTRRWPGGSYDSRLEEKMMAEFHSTKTSSGIGRHRVLIAAMGVILVGGAAFAAVGGVEAVKRMFVNVNVRLMGPDGETYEYVTLQPFDLEDGKATANLNIGEGQEGMLVIERTDGADLSAGPEGAQTFTFSTTMFGVEGSPPCDGETGVWRTVELSIAGGTSDEAAGQDGSLDSMTEPDAARGALMTTTAAVSVDGSPANEEATDAWQTVDLSMTPATGDEADSRDRLFDLIGQPDTIFRWLDAQGVTRELYLVRTTVNEAPAFKVFSVRSMATGDTVSEVIGILFDGVTEGTEVGPVTVDENGLVTVTLIAEDGQEKRVAFNADPNNVDMRTQKFLRVDINEVRDLTETDE